MAEINHDGGSAFPGQQEYTPERGWNQTYDAGMSLRDWFAGHVLSGCIAGIGVRGPFEGKDYESTARFCYRIADAMLRERERKEPANG